MADKFPFSKRRIEAVQPPPSGRLQVRDSKVAGLVLRVTSNGTRTFGIYKKVSGRPLRYKLGTFPEMTVEQARRQATELLAKLGRGENLAAARRAQREAPTVQELFDHWLDHAKAHKRTWRDDQRQFDKYMGRLRGRQLADVTTADVARWHRKLGERHGPYMANRARALLSAMFAKAREIGFNGPNPCLDVKRFKERERERFLQPSEIRPFFLAVAEEPPTWRDFWLLCLFSGARRGNVAAMAWRDIDLDAGLWHLPGEKAKGDLPIVVVVPPPALEILEARQLQVNGSPWVFPADTASGHVIDPRKSWARVLKRSGIEDLRPHDLRRTLGSWQATAGASLQIVGESLGHRDPKATAVYSRLQKGAVQASVNKTVESMLAAGGLLEAPQDTEDDPGADGDR